MPELINDYQAQTRTTAIYPRESLQQILAYVGLGLVGEAGEVANKIKKLIRDQPEVQTIWDLPAEKREEIQAELGDTLWYIARVADELMLDLSVVTDKNLAKLRDRKERNVIAGSGDDR